MLRNIEASALALEHLTENLLDLTRIELGGMAVHTRPTDLLEVVECPLQDARSSIVLDIPDDLPRVQVDPFLLERALCNVVNNAVRFSPPGQAVRIRVTCRRERVLVSVIDHGPGVDPADRQHLFDAFQRFGDRDPGGLGLGLAIARTFTEALGGRLTTSTTPGGGMTMTFHLPIARGDAVRSLPGAAR